jgi:hypothetical protein
LKRLKRNWKGKSNFMRAEQSLTSKRKRS